MTTEAKPEFGRFIIEVNGKPEITEHIQVLDGRSTDLLWKRGSSLYGITLIDNFENGSTVIFRSPDGKTLDTIELKPNESRHWHENDLLLSHTTNG